MLLKPSITLLRKVGPNQSMLLALISLSIGAGYIFGLVLCDSNIKQSQAIQSSPSLLPLIFGVSSRAANENSGDFLDVIGRYLTGLELQKDSSKHDRLVKFQGQAITDALNDAIGVSTVQQIISRSGFGYQNHKVISEDGYVTQLVRIINPLANQTLLKAPPVMLFHGALLDSTSFVWASAAQHNPQPWPPSHRLDLTGSPHEESSSRSLAFALANNGYDVWLVGQRGSNDQNLAHIRFRAMKLHRQKAWMLDSILALGMNRTRQALPADGTFEQDWYDYWKFSMDEIIRFEVPKQIDKVLKVSGMRQVSVVSVSTSAQLILGLLASNELYAAKIHSHVVLGPPINNFGSNMWLKLFQHSWCRHTPDEVGTLLITNLLQSRQLRELLVDQAYKSIRLRYSFIRLIINALAGQSAEFQTLLELPVIGHLMMPIGFRHLKHFCQQQVAGRLQKFDYGTARNLLIYGSRKPPVYDLFNLRVKKWLIISGENDNIATEDSALQLARFSEPKPMNHIRIAGYNHLDLLAGADCDDKVVIPIVTFFDRYQPKESRLNQDQTMKSAKPVSNEIDKSSSKQKTLNSAKRSASLEPPDKLNELRELSTTEKVPMMSVQRLISSF